MTRLYHPNSQEEFGMDGSLSSLTFKGSITEAISEAKKYKKLFLVYVSGDNGDSINLEQSTWMVLNVSSSISKYCIFLHLQQGSVDASQLSAIYPQKTVPCITAIGYNGVQLWQHEGYISPENLVASIEKAWLKLHIQETTATFLTAALASNKSETSTSSSNVFLSEVRSSSPDLPSSLTNRPLQDSETKPPLTELTGQPQVCESTIKNAEAPLQSVHADDLKSGQMGDSSPSSQTTRISLQPVPSSLTNRPLQDSETEPLLTELTGQPQVCESTIKNAEAPLQSVHADDLKSGQMEDSSTSSQTTSTSLQPVPSSLTNRPLQDLETEPPLTELTGQPQVCESTIKNAEAPLQSVHADDLKSGQMGDSSPSSQTTSTSLQPVPAILHDTEGTEVEIESLNVGSKYTDLQESIALNAQNDRISPRSKKILGSSVENDVDNKKDVALDNLINAYTSNDILLNIRLLDGSSLQEKFLTTNDLRLVKDFVDMKQASGSGSYDLAIPYPRKIFGEQDLGKTLSELGLSNRQALIVVPRQLATGSRSYVGLALSSGDSGSNVDQSVGYWGHAKRLLSYVNPFTYLGSHASSSSSVDRPGEGMWQYSPNPQLHNQTSETHNLRTPDTSGSNENAGKRRQTQSSRFGSNIHTLRHDEDDDSRSKDRNTFWNGNSTEYGGKKDDK